MKSFSDLISTAFSKTFFITRITIPIIKQKTAGRIAISAQRVKTAKNKPARIRDQEIARRHFVLFSTKTSFLLMFLRRMCRKYKAQRAVPRQRYEHTIIAG